MKRYPLRRLALGPAPAPERVLFYSMWFRGHNNAIFAELLPRLERVDPYLFTFARRRELRGLQYRAYVRSRRWHDPLVLGLASRRYRFLLTGDPEQLPHFDGRALVVMDDPTFGEREAELLSRPNVAAYVVTKERAARRFEALGVDRPWHVIPQGVSLADRGGPAPRKDGPVVGYHAAWLLTEGDRGGESPLYNVDHLLELWDEIRSRVPEARLWLLGEPSERVRARLAGRDDVVLHGRVPRARVLDHVAAFDVALYARAAGEGVQAAKVADYLGAGVPTVSYDFEVTDELRETGAGVLAATPAELVEAAVRLLRDEPERRRIAEAARRAGAGRDWDVLAPRYAELLDRYLR